MPAHYDVVCSGPIWTDGTWERRVLFVPGSWSVEFWCAADDPEDLDYELGKALGVLADMGALLTATIH